MAKQSHEIKEVQSKIKEFLSCDKDTRIFQNNNTLRLTKLGLKHLQNKLEHWTLDSIELKSKHIIALQKTMRYPYYIDKKVMVLFSKQDAFMAKLAGTDSWLNQLQ